MRANESLQLALIHGGTPARCLASEHPWRSVLLCLPTFHPDMDSNSRLFWPGHFCDVWIVEPKETSAFCLLSMPFTGSMVLLTCKLIPTTCDIPMTGRSIKLRWALLDPGYIFKQTLTGLKVGIFWCVPPTLIGSALIVKANRFLDTFHIILSMHAVYYYIVNGLPFIEVVWSVHFRLLIYLMTYSEV